VEREHATPLRLAQRSSWKDFSKHFFMPDNHPNTIILGAGAAGLYAAYELAKRGQFALILEARSRTGGRIHTVTARDGQPQELGAEFVHGDLPITLGLLREAGLSYTKTGGRWVQVRGGAQRTDPLGGAWKTMVRKMATLENDVTLEAFLQAHYAGPEHAALTDRAVAYAEGFDTADASRASARALGHEWGAPEEDDYRIDAGYGALIDHLVARIEAAGSRILLDHEAARVTTTAAGVEVEAGGQIFRAQQCIVALPLAMLQQRHELLPLIPRVHRALEGLGMGHATKFLATFRRPFWEDAYPGLGFLLSGEEVPTWWTAAPAESNTITGWSSGRAAQARSGVAKDLQCDAALQSLAVLFSRERYALENEMEEMRIINWSADPYTRGSYAYATVGTDAMQRELAAGIDGRIHFAGEWMYSGPAMGTVEAALWSGQQAAARVAGQIGEKL